MVSGTGASSLARGAAVILAILNAFVVPTAFIALWPMGGPGRSFWGWLEHHRGGGYGIPFLSVLVLCPMVLLGFGLWNALSRRGWRVPVALYAVLPTVLGVTFEWLAMRRASAMIADGAFDADQRLRLMAGAMEYASQPWSLGLFLSAMAFTGAAGVTVVAAMGKARRVGLGAVAIRAVIATLFAVVLTKALVLLFEPPALMNLRPVYLVLVLGWLGTLLVSLVVPTDATDEQRGYPLGDLLHIGLFAAAAVLALVGWANARGQERLFTAIGGESILPSQLMKVAAHGIAEFDWAQTRMPLFLLPVVLATVAAVLPAWHAWGAAWKRAAIPGALVLLGLGSVCGVRELLVASGMRRLASFAADCLPRDLTLATAPGGARMSGSKPPLLYVGRENLYSANSLTNAPEVLGTRSLLAGPRCGDVGYAFSRRQPGAWIGVVADEGLTVREMTCILIGFQHELSRGDLPKTWRLPFGIVADPPRSVSPSVYWFTRLDSRELPEPYRGLVSSFRELQIRIQDQSDRSDLVSISIEKDRWTLAADGVREEFAGPLEARVRELRLCERAGHQAQIAVSAPAHAAAREVLAIAGAECVDAVQLDPPGYDRVQEPAEDAWDLSRDRQGGAADLDAMDAIRPSGRGH